MSKFGGTRLVSFQTYQSVRYRHRCCTDTGINSGTNIHTGTGVPVLMYRTCRSVRYRYWCRTELTEVSGNGIDVVPKLPKCVVPVLMSYRTYRSVRYRYWCHTEPTEVVWKSVPVPAVPVSISYRTYWSIRHKYWCRPEVTLVSGTGINVVPNLPMCLVPVIPAVYRRYASVHTVLNTPLEIYIHFHSVCDAMWIVQVGTVPIYNICVMHSSGKKHARTCIIPNSYNLHDTFWKQKVWFKGEDTADTGSQMSAGFICW